MIVIKVTKQMEFDMHSDEYVDYFFSVYKRFIGNLFALRSEYSIIKRLNFAELFEKDTISLTMATISISKVKELIEVGSFNLSCEDDLWIKQKIEDIPSFFIQKILNKITQYSPEDFYRELSEEEQRKICGINLSQGDGRKCEIVQMSYLSALLNFLECEKKIYDDEIILNKLQILYDRESREIFKMALFIWELHKSGKFELFLNDSRRLNMTDNSIIISKEEIYRENIKFDELLYQEILFEIGCFTKKDILSKKRTLFRDINKACKNREC